MVEETPEKVAQRDNAKRLAAKIESKKRKRAEESLIKVRNELHLTWPVKDFKRVRNLIVYKIRCSRKQYGSKIISKIFESNPRKFHDLVQNIIGKKVTRVEVRDVNGKPLLPSEMNDFFASICEIHLQLRKLPPNDSVSNIPILEICSVAKKLKALDSRKSSYPNGYQLIWLLSVLIFHLLL